MTIQIREYAPLCLTHDSSRGGVNRGLARIGAASSMARRPMTVNISRMPRVLGRVTALFRYPVKSMAAEPLQQVEVSWNGFDGDRRWAFIRGGLVRSGFPWLTIRENPSMWKYEPYFANTGDPNHSTTMV